MEPTGAEGTVRLDPIRWGQSTSCFTDGTPQQDIVMVPAAQFRNSCGYRNPVVVPARTGRPATAGGASITRLSVLKIAELNRAKSTNYNYHIDSGPDS
jgi:hypothetical protein